MEVEERDAQIGHEATVSKVGEDQLFYLMSRGLSESQAMSMIVNGFIEPSSARCRWSTRSSGAGSSSCRWRAQSADRVGLCPAPPLSPPGEEAGAVPMREECKHFQSRSYATGEVVRFCELDLAPEAPWRCPDGCASYDRATGRRGMASTAAWSSRPSRTSPVPVAPMSSACSKRPRTSSTPWCPRRWPRCEREERSKRETRPAVVAAPLTLRARRPAPVPGSAASELRRPFLHEGGHGLDQVVGLEEPGVPGRHVVEAVGHRSGPRTP